MGIFNVTVKAFVVGLITVPRIRWGQDFSGRDAQGSSAWGSPFSCVHQYTCNIRMQIFLTVLVTQAFPF